jgi:hypothetical protein
VNDNSLVGELSCASLTSRETRITHTRNRTEAAIFGAIDYKRTFARTYASDEERFEAYSQCHLRSAKRVLRALLANGGKSALIIRHTEERIEARAFQRGIHKVRTAHGFAVSSPNLRPSTRSF